MKLPAFQFYPGDWLRDPIAGCSLEAQGLWLRMMMIMHDSDRYGYLAMNGSPIPPRSVAARCGCTLEQYETLLAELSAYGVPSVTECGIVYSRRMVRDARAREATRQRVSKFRENRKELPENKKILPKKASRNAAVTVDVTGSVTPVKQPSSSSSSSSISINRTTPLPPTGGGAVVKAWIDLHKELGLPPPLVDGKETAQAKRLSSALCDAEIRPVMQAFLADPDPWLTQNGRALSWLNANRINKYRQRLAGVASPNRQTSSEAAMAAQKATENWHEH